MILSNKKLRLIITILLLLIFCSFIGIYKPKAYTQTNYINCGFSGHAPVSDLIDSTFYSRQPINCSGNIYEPMVNYGEGTLIFSFGAQNYDSTNGQWHEIIGVTISGDGEYTCDLGSTTQWLNNGTQYIVTTAKCPVKFSNGQGINSINFQRNGGTGRVNVKLSEFATFVSKDTTNVNVNQQEVVNAVNNSNQQMITQMQTQTQSINDIKDTLKDDSIDTNTANNKYSGFSNTANSNMNNTPVSNLIALPISFLTGVNSAISNSCTNVNYIELYDYQLVLPCLNLADRLGSVWVIIDTICSCMLLFSIGKSLVSTFARLSDMDTNIMYECYSNGKSHRGESFND